MNILYWTWIFVKTLIENIKIYNIDNKTNIENDWNKTNITILQIY